MEVEIELKGVDWEDSVVYRNMEKTWRQGIHVSRKGIYKGKDTVT